MHLVGFLIKKYMLLLLLIKCSVYDTTIQFVSAVRFTWPYIQSGYFWVDGACVVGVVSTELWWISYPMLKKYIYYLKPVLFNTIKCLLYTKMHSKLQHLIQKNCVRKYMFCGVSAKNSAANFVFPTFSYLRFSLTFCWSCIMQWFLVTVQLDAQIVLIQSVSPDDEHDMLETCREL